MLCTTEKNGTECFFMSKKGCTFNGGRCHTVVPSCDGCAHVREYENGNFCLSYADPATKWRAGICVKATHVKRDAGAEHDTKHVNPLKASKRKMR